MLTQDDIEHFLDRLTSESGVSFDEIEPGLWVVKPGGALEVDVVVHYSPPVVLFRVKVMTLPANERMHELNRRLLELNATDLVHGSYGIANNSIVLTEALELSHLDYEEFQAAYESMTLALATHLRELAAFREEH